MDTRRHAFCQDIGSSGKTGGHCCPQVVPPSESTVQDIASKEDSVQPIKCGQTWSDEDVNVDENHGFVCGSAYLPSRPQLQFLHCLFKAAKKEVSCFSVQSGLPAFGLQVQSPRPTLTLDEDDCCSWVWIIIWVLPARRQRWMTQWLIEIHQKVFVPNCRVGRKALLCLPLCFSHAPAVSFLQVSMFVRPPQRPSVSLSCRVLMILGSLHCMTIGLGGRSRHLVIR